MAVFVYCMLLVVEMQITGFIENHKTRVLVAEIMSLGPVTSVNILRLLKPATRLPP